MRVAIYARVSTKDKGQDTENQLREFAERHGTLYKIFTDQESKVGGMSNYAISKAMSISASTVAK